MFDWNLYFRLARKLKELAKNDSYLQEAYIRSAVSRAYYAAFGQARRFAESKLGFEAKQGASDHKELRDCLKQNSYTGAAEWLDDLRRWRNSCDYDESPLESTDVRAMCDQALTQANNVLQCLQPVAPVA